PKNSSMITTQIASFSFRSRCSPLRIPSPLRRKMKTKIILISLALCIAQSAYARRHKTPEGGGVSGGNGGLFDDTDFVAIGRDVADFIEAHGDELKLPMNKWRLAK